MSCLDTVPGVATYRGLAAIRKASIPSMLISSKCDYPPAKRDLDPVQIEETAKSRIGNIETLQTTFAGSDAHKRGVSVLLKAIQANKHGTSFL